MALSSAVLQRVIRQLAERLAQTFLPFLSCESKTLTLSDWQTALPCEFFPQLLASRTEDGGGLCSTAVWHTPQIQDTCTSLRRQWTVRLFQTGLHKVIMDHFTTRTSAPPLSSEQLQPFLHDLLQILEIPPNQWEAFSTVAPGQPFRLALWKKLLQSMSDPDAPFIDQLQDGVRLGVNNVIAPSPLWPLQDSTTSDDQELLQCESSWKSALDQPDVVWPLLEEECHAGFIEKVPGGLEALRSQHASVAVGKLGLVCADNRSPRLVVDSTVSGVTANTSIPNRMLLPRISDVLQASPLVHTSRHVLAFTLDVAKAHRRIKIAPEDQGLLCFWYQDTLFKSKTLNFGARASGYFWSRVAGLMVRSFHRILHVQHALFQYVDDLLILLDATTSPIWVSILTLTCLVLGIPMSWHKTEIGEAVTWIGWRIHVQRWVVSITPDKRIKILSQIDALLKQSRCDLSLLESLTGRLLWVSSLWDTLRPLLGPLYHAMMSIPITLVSISPAQWSEILQCITDDLILTKSLAHPSLRKAVKLVRVANFTLRDLSHARSLHFKSRRIWLGIQIPGSSKRKLLSETHAALQAWRDVLTGTPFLFDMLPAPHLSVTASADACATSNEAGLGGSLRINNQVVAWFAFTITLPQAQDQFSWLSDSMQKHINVWELLGQFALAYCLDRYLQGRSHPIAAIFACDNTSAEAAHLKALSTSKGMCQILAAFFRFQRIHNLNISIQHIPGIWNDEADALSRGRNVPDCTPALRMDIPWQWLTSSSSSVSPAQAKFPHTLLEADAR